MRVADLVEYGGVVVYDQSVMQLNLFTEQPPTLFDTNERKSNEATDSNNGTGSSSTYRS